MNAILHGTWVTGADGREDDLFFVWAERAAPAPKPRHTTPRVQRHPYGATTIEIADLLSAYVPQRDWRSAERMTRIAFLPSDNHAPIVPRWMIDDGEEIEQENNGTGPTSLKPWRVEGIGVPLLHMLDVLAALPSMGYNLDATHHVGNDLRYWGVVAKFVLELLARQRFIPGLRFQDQAVHAVWMPVLDEPSDQERLELLTRGMPPACRAIFHDASDLLSTSAPTSRQGLQSFVEHLIDQAVRGWGQLELKHGLLRGQGAILTAARRPATIGIGSLWWAALWSVEKKIGVPPSREDEVTRFYQAWQSWTYRAQPTADVPFRLCFRLEPPEFDTERARVVSSQWTLRYFLQAKDDPSLLVPAGEVWRERGEVLNYLNRRFDRPQETLLAGLGLAARLSPAIQRSLRSECPEDTTLTSQEAYTFLRETARLLEGMNFGVLVPPWWNKPDTRLRVRAKLHLSQQEAASGILSMDSLVAYDWELALGDEALTHEEFERLAALKTPLVRVRGRWVLLQPDQVEAAIAFWQKQQEREQLAFSDALSLALGVQKEIDGLSVSEVELDGKFNSLVNTITRGDQIENLETPTGFLGQLRPYQSRGASWLAFLRRWGFGACLADDMGLGKTIQAIALILHEREKNGVKEPSLVICPTSVVGNWQREVARFAPELKLMIHHGSGRAEGQSFIEQSLSSDLVISTYGLVRRDIQDLSKIYWGNIILDEAQNIKNPLTKQAKAVRNLRGGYRIALTGTPVENHLSELWSIMSFLNPGYLGSRESFQRNWAIPIERYQDPEASEQLRKLVRLFILRRVKTDPQVIQDLPEKFEQKVYCNLTREQATLYEAVIRDAMSQLQETGGENNSIKRRGLILAMLTRLKQVCNHPALFLGDRSTTAGRSGKLNRLVEMLEEVLAVNDRALIFTQFAQMGHLLQRHLQNVFGQEVLFLHGGTPQKQRDRMLTRFQEDEGGPAVFILSLKAGGTGLNLMRANHVFHYDRWWNPAVENQATDRAYRIGQTRDVQVHKFICLGTLEERVDALIESKSALAESVVGTGEGWLTELSTDELYDLMSLRSEAVEVE